jgi:MFS family permease
MLGAILGAAAAITLPIPLWAGALADRVGARPLVIAAQVLQALAYLAYGSVTEPVGIFLAAATGAIGVRLFWSSVFTLIADYADHVGSSRKDLWYAWANIARTVGIGAGGLITGLVIADGRDAAYRAIAYASFACYTVAAITLAAFVRLPRHHRPAGAEPSPGYRTLLRDRTFLGLTGVNVFFALSTLMLGLSLPTFIQTALRGPAWLTSTILVGNAILIALLGSRITRRLAGWRRTQVLRVAAALWAGWGLAYFGIAEVRAGVIVGLIVATFLFTLAEVLHAPASMAIAATIAPSSLRGRYLAVFQYSWIAAEIGAPVFFTTLFEVGYGLPFLILAGVNGVAVVLTLGLERSVARRTEVVLQPSSTTR